MIQINAAARLASSEIVTAAALGKLTGAKLRDAFIKWAGGKGFSLAKHQNKLTINKEPIKYATGSTGISGGAELKKAALAFTKEHGFKKDGSSTRPKVVWYKDASGNPVSIGDSYDSSFPVAVRFD